MVVFPAGCGVWVVEDRGAGVKTLQPVRRRLLFGFVAGAALVIKLCLAFFTYGTNDAFTFEQMLETLNNRGAVTLYREGTPVLLDDKVIARPPMNHPPFSLTLLRFWDLLRNLTGLSLRFWMRACCAFADLIAVSLLWALAEKGRLDWRAVLIVAGAPAAIMISGFHGNTDSIMIAFSVIAAYLIETEHPAWIAGVAFGLSCSVKVWPLVLFPVLALSAGSFRRSLQFMLAGLGTAFLAAMPWLATDPQLIFRQVFYYSPVRGWWGLSYLWPQSLDLVRYIVFGISLAAAVGMYRRIRSVVAQCAVVASLFLFLAPGFGPQYLAWVVPWTCAAGWRTSAGFHAASAVFLFGMYNTWSLGLPWNYGNAFNLYKVPFPAWVYPTGLVAWGLLPIVAMEVWWRNRTVPTRVSL